MRTETHADDGTVVTVDLMSMPVGQRYEDRYQGYLDVFKKIAAIPGRVRVVARQAPWSWVPLLKHLNVTCIDSRMYFDYCPMVHGALKADIPVEGRGAVPSRFPLDRTAVEVLCSFRPETADALWKVDMQWKPPEGRVRQYHVGKEFIVTTNGAYHRPEVQTYMNRLFDDEYRPPQRNVVLVPCAADKPYPAPMHKAVLERMPPNFYMANATGVVGLVPQDLWPIMPHYDSGIPNEWRLYEVCRAYFLKHQHDRVVVYCDFYSHAIDCAFRALWPRYASRVHFVIKPGFYPDYIDLMDKERLILLEEAFKRPWDFERRRPLPSRPGLHDGGFVNPTTPDRAG